MSANGPAISRHAVEVELAAGTLALVRFPGWKVRRHLSLVHSHDVPLTPAAQRFVEGYGRPGPLSAGVSKRAERGRSVAVAYQRMT